MRSLSTLKNMIMSLLYEVMLILFGMVAPRLIIDTYGSEVNGLTSTVTHMLSILNLLQAGAVGASIFRMYKPVAEKDYYQVSMVLELSRRYFRKVGILFLILVVAAIPLMNSGTESEIAYWERALAFIILGVNGAAYFFFTSWYDILFSSHQKRFLLSLAGIVEKLLYYALLFAVIFLKFHFVWMYVAVLTGTCVKILFLYTRYRKEFKPLLVKVKPDKSFKIENRGYLLCNQIAAQVVDAMPVVLLSRIVSDSAVSVYAIYNLVQNMIKMVVRTVQLSVSEVFGNLTASSEEKRVSRVYNLLEFVFFLAATVLCCCAGFLFMPFIYLYTDGGYLDVSYMYPALAAAIVAYDVCYCMYMPIYTLTNVYGFFKETYLQAIISAVIAAGVAVGLGFLYWPLIMLGPVFYYVSMLICRTIVAKKKVPWLRLGTFFRRIAVVLLTVSASIALSAWVYGSGGYAIGSWWAWIGNAVLFGLSTLLVVGVYVLIFERSAAKGLLGYVKRLIMKRRKENREV